MVDGIKLHNFMVALTKVMAAAIAQDDPDAGTRDAAYEPGGARHVRFLDASKSTQGRRFDRVTKFFDRARRAIGKKDYSAAVGTGVANALNRKGHGALEGNGISASKLEHSLKLSCGTMAHARS